MERTLDDIDRDMRALNRPAPPVVKWLASKPKGLMGKAAWDAACLEWEREKVAWSVANPHAAEEWAFLRAEAFALEEQLEGAKWGKAREAYLHSKARRMGVPSECLHAATRGHVTPTLDATREWWKITNWCLLLFGGFGIGKTSAAAWAVLEFMRRGERAKWVRAPAACRAPLFGAEAMVFTQECRSVPVLVLDDVGADLPTDGWRAWLEDVIDARWGNQRRTIITVNNLDGAAFAARMGERLTDRLRTATKFDGGKGSMRVAVPSAPPPPERVPGEEG